MHSLGVGISTHLVAGSTMMPAFSILLRQTMLPNALGGNYQNIAETCRQLNAHIAHILPQLSSAPSFNHPVQHEYTEDPEIQVLDSEDEAKNVQRLGDLLGENAHGAR